MTEPQEKIVIYDSFDNVIKANIIKTKLDAYGIPCFLTGEAFLNVYPFQNELFPGVRLYIFEKDMLQVRSVLVEEHIPENEIIRCPKCFSKNVSFEESQQGNFFRVLTTLVLGLFFQAKKVYRCQDCENEFNPG